MLISLLPLILIFSRDASFSLMIIFAIIFAIIAYAIDAIFTLRHIFAFRCAIIFAAIICFSFRFRHYASTLLIAIITSAFAFAPC